MVTGQTFDYAVNLATITFADPQWTQRAVAFTASSTSTTIESVSVEPNNGNPLWRYRGPMIDDVAVGASFTNVISHSPVLLDPRSPYLRFNDAKDRDPIFYPSFWSRATAFKLVGYWLTRDGGGVALGVDWCGQLRNGL